MTVDMKRIRAHIEKLSKLSRMPNVEHVADDHNAAVDYLRIWCGLDAPPDAAFHEEIRAIARRTGTPEAMEFAEKLIASGVKDVKRGAA